MPEQAIHLAENHACPRIALMLPQYAAQILFGLLKMALAVPAAELGNNKLQLCLRILGSKLHYILQHRFGERKLLQPYESLRGFRQYRLTVYAGWRILRNG